MPKITVYDKSPAPDKTGDGRLDAIDEWSKRRQVALDRCITDLMYIQNHPKLYINEKKQLQSFIYKLNELDYYETHKTAMDKIGLA